MTKKYHIPVSHIAQQKKKTMAIKKMNTPRQVESSSPYKAASTPLVNGFYGLFRLLFHPLEGPSGTWRGKGKWPLLVMTLGRSEFRYLVWATKGCVVFA